MTLSFSQSLNLPTPPAPLGIYEPGIIHNGIGVLSGQYPSVDGKVLYSGRVGAELTDDQGKESAKAAALNVLAQIDALIEQDWDRFTGLLRVDGFIASADDWMRQPQVLDAASELFLSLLGDRGRHARTVLGVPRLPLNYPIKLVVSFAVRTN